MAFQTRKVAIIGCGRVGAHCALTLATNGECDELILIDKDKPKAQAQAIDLSDAGAWLPHRVRVRAGDWADCREADIAVLCVGEHAKMHRPRTDMLASTVATVREITRAAVDAGFAGIFVVVCDPCDVAAACVREESGFDLARVMATGTALDSARLRRELSNLLEIDQRSIRAVVMGEHGESQMVPWSNISVGGKRLLDLMSEHPGTFGRMDLSEVAKNVRDTAWTIMDGKGAAEFGIAAAVCDIARAIFHDERRVLPVSVLLRGEFGQKDVFAGVPALLGRAGVIEVVEIPMTDAERGDFAASCEAIRYYIALAAQQN